MTDKPPTLLERALLGLVRQAPRSGYDLRKIFETTPMGHYSGSPGALYPALRRLERKGLLRARVDRSRRLRPREVFAPTPRGLDSLRSWLGADVTRNDIVWGMEELMLRFAFMEGLIPRARVEAFLESLAGECDRYARELQEFVREVRDQGSLHGRLALECGLDDYKAKARWARKARKELSAARGPRKRHGG